ncbi:hypothetical protein FT663_02079 [Candidozyma haemuli var. vulneris]|uniref:Zn(2)-C6 fungal-type domain-containing protein n=1 Tax=Candidozyma haemuli TaxID=45357 RepID=A0A2V1APX7_9ASCO|nr:hypothetical protein CXQ85_001910 [[Candida] haemuloni]KAF3988686.1 hypothetical protein FT662_03290 [[Candida] haemuloni var. vulneris]KAF3992920.1 hypothetical protein FT663_02079 [[Candida] haemuloni var. vulneris]PVH20130.1 hypothetical protein CXQ85_001910 [[Candida] haemuloni]
MTSDETVVPCIRTRKRRLVPPDKRKKASFSCDRCKIRKIACHRDSPSSRCAGCERAGASCETTIKRKKKIRGPIENIGLHYKCLLALIQHSFPEIDVNNIDALIDVGERHGISMPSRYGGKDDNELRDLSLLITSGKLPSSRSSSLDSDFDIKVEDSDDLAAESVQSETAEGPGHHQDDLFITDHSGNRHMVGPLASPAFLDSSVKALGTMFDLDQSTCASLQHAFQGELVISSSNEPINAADLSFLYHSTFPCLDDISMQEANYFVDCFFGNVHPRYPCFVENVFREAHERFWAAVSTKTRDRYLSHHTICSIYMVWLLGRLFNPNSLPRVDYSIVQRYLHVIRLCLSDIVLTPTLDGIRTLILLAIFMENTMRRESAYVLIQLAARHSISLGLHRESSVMQIPDKSKVEESRRLWWTVFVMEVSSSCQMGRSSTVKLADVNATYPDCYDIVNAPEFSATWMAILDVTKNLHDVLEYRQAFNKNEDLLSNDNIDKALVLEEKLSRTVAKIDPGLFDLSMISDFKVHLSMRYHYDRLSLVLPFFSRVAQAPHHGSNRKIQSLLVQGLRSCIAIANIAQASFSAQMLNGTVHADVFYTFHATMGLVVGYCLMSNSQLSSIMKLDIPIEEVEQAIEKIRGLGLATNGMCMGTLLKISGFIDAFIAGYDYLTGQHQQRGAPRPLPYGEAVPSAEHEMSEMLAATKSRVKVEDNCMNGGFEDFFIRPLRNDYDPHSGLQSADISQFGDLVFNGGIPGFGTGFCAPERYSSEGVGE